ncbi:MAG: hypothetical protein RMA76_36855 [Deltaproteobacteria bacterium]|jgi:hypothetical protein
MALRLVKIPPPPLTYSKDRTLTRRTVKGAAGGMKGVDYEDDRRPDVSTEKATAGAGSNAESHAVEAARHAKAHEQVAKNAEPEEKPGKIREEDEMVLDDEDAITRDKKAKENRRNFVPRDRMTVDKDAPKLLRKHSWSEDEEEDEAFEEEEEQELDLDAIGEAVFSPELEEAHDTRTRRRPGDPALTDPADIQRLLGAPHHYAKHVMILAEAFRSATGATRREAIGYLTAMFCAAPDRSFGRLALKEFGPATGILDIYPLEVVEDILTRYPAFLPKVGFGRLFADVPRDASRPLLLIANEPTLLSYPAQVKIRGFAVRGGDRPGYRFEPAAEPGTYALTVHAGGEFAFLVSALVKSGHTIIDRLHVQVAGEPRELPADTWPERDAEKVAAWPIPTPPPIDPREALEPHAEEVDPSLMSSSQIIQKKQMGALRGPKGEDYEAQHGFAYEDELDDVVEEELERFSLESDDAIELVDGPPTDEIEIPPDITDDVPMAFDDTTHDDLDALAAGEGIEVVGADTIDEPLPSAAQSALIRIREEAGGDRSENALSVADRALLDIAFATLADEPLPSDEEE